MSRLSFALVLITLFVLSDAETLLSEKTGGFMPGPEAPILASEIQECLPVWRLSLLKATLEAEESLLLHKVFGWLFPFGPAWNSILGTFYISSVPNFILAFIPAQINANTLNTMTAFATGGLLSDVFLHLVPHSFMGENHNPGQVQFVMVEEKRNILIGLGIFTGFAAFFMMEKTLRVLGGEEGAGHSHSHSHTNGEVAAQASGVSPKKSKDGLRARKSGKEVASEAEEPARSATGPSKMSAYLNLFGDFVHNITDGLAMAASFYASPLIGATTTLACFAHEIPHEIADYSILIRSGFTKKQAMQSQFLTAVGAFVGTFIGIAVHTATASDDTSRHSADLAAGVRQDADGLLGTTVHLSDLVIPFVAGGFLYIGAVAVLPTLLAESKSGAQAIREFVAMAVGVGCMFLVAWNE
ncbi:ZIP-like iron-zinc transporter [Mycena epipterygia]|nr:ZIP-like iron-zinc transporter [Mycena epipterygia]